MHWKALKRIFRYLQGTSTAGLHIKPCSSFSFAGCFLPLSGFSDADWTASPDDRKSVGGYCVYLGDSLVSWSSRKQQAVARSSTESEYRALSNLTSEILWIQSLLKEIWFPSPSSAILWCDNMSAISLACNPVFHARIKHIELDVHFIRDIIQAKQVQVRYVPSVDQTC